MQILFNELSIEEQFSDFEDFRNAISSVMSIRASIKKKMNTELRCHRGLSTERKINPRMTVHDAVLNLDMETRRVILSWLNRGPYWDGEEQTHTGDRWLQVKQEVVTDTSVGEAGWQSILEGKGPAYLVSLTPSRWDYTPIPVEIMEDGSEHQVEQTVEVTNVSDHSVLNQILESFVADYKTWAELEDHCKKVFQRLRFSDDWFDPMEGIPFTPSAARNICNRLDVLNETMILRDHPGVNTPEYKNLFQDRVVAGNSFSDESEANKTDMRSDLTFRHPDRPGEALFCPWHAKIPYKYPIRIHFRWPDDKDPLYVVYCGKHIT